MVEPNLPSDSSLHDHDLAGNLWGVIMDTFQALCNANSSWTALRMKVYRQERPNFRR